MSDYLDEYPYALIRDLLWCRKYHMMLVREIDGKLMKISKKYEITITLDD